MFVSELSAKHVVTILGFLRRRGWWSWHTALKELIKVNNTRGVQLGQINDLLDQYNIAPGSNPVERIHELIDSYEDEIDRHEAIHESVRDAVDGLKEAAEAEEEFDEEFDEEYDVAEEGFIVLILGDQT
jgi:hypothetical protein